MKSADGAVTVRPVVVQTEGTLKKATLAGEMQGRYHTRDRLYSGKGGQGSEGSCVKTCFPTSCPSSSRTLTLTSICCVAEAGGALAP